MVKPLYLCRHFPEYLGRGKEALFGIMLCYICSVTLDLQRKVLLLFQIMILGSLDGSCMMPHSRRREHID